MKLLPDPSAGEAADASRNEIAKILDYLEQRLPAYPFRRDVDRVFVDELIADFPEVNLLEQIKAFRWYYDNEPFTHLRNPRLALRRWIANTRSSRRR